MEEVEHILILIMDRELTAVKLVESASLWLQKQAHHEREHQHVQLIILIDGSYAPFFHVENFL